MKGKGLRVGNYWIGNITAAGMHTYAAADTDLVNIHSCTFRDITITGYSSGRILSTGVLARTTPKYHHYWDATALMVPVHSNNNADYQLGGTTITFVTEDPGKDWRIDWGNQYDSQFTIMSVIIKLV
jgi:hypothetical protein